MVSVRHSADCCVVHYRRAISTLVITMILLFFTVVTGLTFGGTLLERVAEYMEINEAEVVTATAIHRDDTLHVRINFKHVLGSGFDRVAVAELAVGDSYVERDTAPLVPEHDGLDYRAAGWDWHDGTACPSWTIATQPWPPPSPITLPTITCQMDIYQRIDDGDARPEMLNLKDGNTAVLEFVLVGLDPPPAGAMGVAVEYGLADRTAITDDADVALFVRP